MLASVLAAMRVPDLKKRITFVFLMFAVYVVGLHIPVTVSKEAMEKLANQSGMLGLLNAFTGGAFKKFTIFAMGIIPYINASIIMQLLTMASPRLEELQKEGEPGQKKIKQYIRWGTGLLAFVQAFGMIQYLRGAGVNFTGIPMQLHVVLTLVGGTAFLMWLGEMITDKGIGNGVSLIIFAGIVASLPSQLVGIVDMVHAHSIGWGNVIALAVVFVATVAAIIAVTQAQRKIPVQHVKRVVGNKMYGGQTSYLPLKVNSAGVIPIIFAISLQLLPMTLAQVATGLFHLPQDSGIGGFLVNFGKVMQPGPKSILGTLVYAVLIILFTYFYTAVQFNVADVADNLKKWGSFIPGIRPGKPTIEYLDRILTRLTLAGAIFLALIALAQYFIPAWLGITSFTLVGGTSLLIIVGVALETMQAIEAQMLMRHYEGFIK